MLFIRCAKHKRKENNQNINLYVNIEIFSCVSWTQIVFVFSLRVFLTMCLLFLFAKDILLESIACEMCNRRVN